MFPDSHHISASTETLMRQAPMTIADYMRDAVKFIDEQFGEGFAKQNPALVSAFIQASALDYHTAYMKIAAQELGGDVATVSTAIEALATAVSAAG